MLEEFELELLDHLSELVFVEVLFDVLLLVLAAYAAPAADTSARAAQTANNPRILAGDITAED